MLHDEFRSHRVQVERKTRISDGAGGWTESYSVLGTVEGSVQPQGAAEQVVADAERAEGRWQLFADPGVDVLRDDRLTVVAVVSAGEWTDVAAGRVFRVVSVGDWQAGSELDHVAVTLEEIQRGR